MYISGGKTLDIIKIELKNRKNNQLMTLFIDVFDNSLATKWLHSLNNLLKNQYHLEKNYCFFGFPDGDRNGQVILDQINASIAAINSSNIDYYIDDHFTLDNTLGSGEVGDGKPGLRLDHSKTNWLHRYFEDLQGVSGNISPYFHKAGPTVKWHIRQLNLLCHEYESWALSYRKSKYAPEWSRPSQLMCWLNAPRFTLEENDYNLFGVDTINRRLGAVYVGVNKAVGKHHWEVFNDEGRDSRISELITTTLKSQTEAAGDFDIEWARDPGSYPWQQQQLKEFRNWLTSNGFDPADKSLTIGHPQVAQVNLDKSFGTENYFDIWKKLHNYLDVYSVSTSDHCAVYEYHWSDNNYIEQQIKIIAQGN
jgi:hypothetical protein